MILHRRRAKSRTSRTVLRHAVKAAIEQLENRRLLTTIHGGDTIEFQDYGTTPVRITVVGPTSAQFDLIGATSAPSAGATNGQVFTLNDIPAKITTSGGQVINELGGVGGVDGVNPIGTVTGGDSLTDLFGNGIAPTIEAPSSGINFTALSSNSRGVTWGLNLLQVQLPTQSKVLELANFDYRNSSDATVYADLAPRVIQLIGTIRGQDMTNVTTNSIDSVIACDFLPTNDNLLYIGVNVTVPRFTAATVSTTPTDASIPFLFVYNFATGTLNFANPAQPEFFSQSLAGPLSFGDLAPTVLGFSFASDDTLVASVIGRDITGTGDLTGISTKQGIVSIPDPNDPVFRIAQSRLNPEPVIQSIVADLTPITDFHGLEVIPGDDGFVYGISSQAPETTGIPSLLHVQLTGPNAGEAIDYGPLPDPQDNRATKRGSNLGDLDWNPVLTNPFHNPGVTPRKGVLISEDTGTDELVVVDQRERFPQTNLFAIYGTNTTNDTSISIARVPALTAQNRPMIPFAGGAGPIRTVNAQTGVLSDGTTGTPDGTVFIGALTRNLIPDSINAKEDQISVRRIRKTPSQSFGNLPKGTKYVYAGITIEGNIHNVLVGGTVTGNVDIEGSADLLYAGDWLTGDANGILQLDDLNDDINDQDIMNNFFVHGDLRTLASGTDFGSLDNDAGVNKPDYLSGFNLHVGGRLGDIWSPSGSIEGSVNVSNTFAGSSETQQEIEDKRGDTSNSQSYFQGLDTGDAPSLGDLLTVDANANTQAGGNPAGPFSNDTFATAQYLATAQNDALGSDEVVAVDGSITNEPKINDKTDYYAIGLMAGQSVTVQLTSNGPLNVGVFDPDDSLIASDHRGLQTTDTNYVTGQPFRFTATEPGAYRFAIGFTDDGDFTGSTLIRDTVKYTLRITGLDNIGLGGVDAGANVLTYENNVAGISVHNGDLGAVTAAGEIFDIGDPLLSTDNSTLGDVYLVNHGNLRSVDAPSVGLATGATETAAGTVNNGINIIVPRGSVGLLRASAPNSPTSVLEVNRGLYGVLVDNRGLPDADYAVGGQIELADSESEYDANLSADGAIGSVRANEMTVISPPIIIANADRAGSDGVIDLIDVNGDMGTINGGGPQIYTGPGGNVRYMRAGGTVYNNYKFGSGVDEPILEDPGASAKLVDDSGTPIKITPTPNIVNPNFDPTSTSESNQFLDPGQLSVLTYSTNDATKGGVVIMRVAIDPYMPGTGYPNTGTTAKTGITVNHGIDFDSGSSGNLSSVEIGEVDTFNSTTSLITEIDPGQTVTNTDGSTTTNTGSAPELILPTEPNPVQSQTAPDTTTPVDLTFDGKSRIDVWSIVGRVKPSDPTTDDESTTDIAAAVAPGAIDNIDNETDGEVVNVDAGSVNNITAQWVGIARSHTGVDPSSADNAVNGVTVLDNGAGTATTVSGGTGGGVTTITSVASPFVQQRNLVHIHGDATSYLVSVDARKGVGNISVQGIIGTITANSDGKTNPGGGFEGIDGPIVATPGTADTPWDARIEDVDIGQGILWGGSGDVPGAGIFAGDTIGAVHGEGVGADIHGIIHAGSDPGTAFSPTDGFTIGTISLKGGSLIDANIGITDSFNDWRSGGSAVAVPEIGDTLTKPLFDIGKISLTGVGGVIGTFIQGSDIGPVDINGGFGFINSEIDSLSNNQVVGVDTTGYGIRGSIFIGGEDMEEMIARGTGKALNVNSFSPTVLQSRNNLVDPFTGREYTPLNDLDKLLGTNKKHPIVKSVSASGVIENTDASFGNNLGTVSAYEIRGRDGGSSEFDISNTTNKITLTGGTDEFTLNTGSMNKFTTGDDVSNSLIGATGAIGQVNIGGTLRGTSTVSATGPNGTISSLRTKRALYGAVNANVGIGTISVGTDLGSPAVATFGNLDLLDVTGSILDSAIVSNLKKGAFVPLRKIGDLEVGGDVDAGAVIRAKAINKQHVGGTIKGSIIIGS